jgi:glycerol-3-phosphate O-acyltransferase / dihydroxyacetone phosphate acyltransferase
MWLLPFLPRIARFALRVYYRLDTAGPAVPASGPVLLVANHPNSLLDAAFVAGAARRPVRFLAKAPLFEDRLVGWLVRAAGAVPVYRAMDDPGQTARNAEAFEAVHAALAAGAAVGIFPEGISHSQPSLVSLRTGAARIALGAAELHGTAFPVIPVGIILRQKERFRSEALVLVGEPVDWNDLARQGAQPTAVREMTRRIDRSIRDVTVNLERWEDEPLVQGAVEVWTVETGRAPEPAQRVAWTREAAETLARLRRTGDPTWTPVARDLERHLRALRVLRFNPADIREAASLPAAARWTLHKLVLFTIFGIPGALGVVLFWIPYRVTGALEARARVLHDVRATFRVLVGGVLFTSWTVMLILVAAMLAGWTAAGLALLLLPILGILALALRDRASDARFAAIRFLRLRRAARVDELRERQRGLAERLARLREALTPEADRGEAG